ncbi:unnamed protein product [Absidia cylindrospora]
MKRAPIEKCESYESQCPTTTVSQTTYRNHDFISGNYNIFNHLYTSDLKGKKRAYDHETGSSKKTYTTTIAAKEDMPF